MFIGLLFLNPNYHRTSGNKVCDSAWVRVHCSDGVWAFYAVCSAGKYREEPGETTCRKCAEAKYSTVVGSNSSDNCLACPANSHTEDKGSDELTDCQCNIGFTGECFQ
jgi:hypothetical protein